MGKVLFYLDLNCRQRWLHCWGSAFGISDIRSKVEAVSTLWVLALPQAAKGVHEITVGGTFKESTLFLTFWIKWNSRYSCIALFR